MVTFTHIGNIFVLIDNRWFRHVFIRAKCQILIFHGLKMLKLVVYEILYDPFLLNIIIQIILPGFIQVRCLSFSPQTGNGTGLPLPEPGPGFIFKSEFVVTWLLTGNVWTLSNIVGYLHGNIKCSPMSDFNMDHNVSVTQLNDSENVLSTNSTHSKANQELPKSAPDHMPAFANYSCSLHCTAWSSLHVVWSQRVQRKIDKIKISGTAEREEIIPWSRPSLVVWKYFKFNTNDVKQEEITCAWKHNPNYRIINALRPRKTMQLLLTWIIQH